MFWNKQKPPSHTVKQLLERVSDKARSAAYSAEWARKSVEEIEDSLKLMETYKRQAEELLKAAETLYAAESKDESPND